MLKTGNGGVCGWTPGGSCHAIGRLAITLVLPFQTLVLHDLRSMDINHEKKIKAHRLFMIRSYAFALVFVVLRIIVDLLGDVIFFYIQSPEMRDATQEWLSWIPLLKGEPG
ncbi:MAG: hypothetical protein KDC93_18080 [Cyclobacteriaceae bacterium]|nr:hypothetical protein [Cyclobacteriaceae bacterium]